MLIGLNPPDGPDFVSVYLDTSLVFSSSLEVEPGDIKKIMTIWYWFQISQYITTLYSSQFCTRRVVHSLLYQSYAEIRLALYSLKMLNSILNVYTSYGFTQYPVFQKIHTVIG